MATVTLTWDAPNSGGAVEHYKVYRKAGAGHTPAAVKASPDATFPKTVTDINSRTYPDTSLASQAGVHCWVVTAANNGGAQESAPSNVTSLDV